MATNATSASSASVNNVLFSNSKNESKTPSKTIAVVKVPAKTTKAKAEPTPKVEVKPIEEPKTKVEVKPIAEPTPKVEPAKPMPLALSMRQLQDRAEKLHLLSVKYDALCEKRRDLHSFEISHDGDTAKMHLTDAKGNEFVSSNPVCIRQLIDLWIRTYSEAMERTENKMREILAQ